MLCNLPFFFPTAHSYTHSTHLSFLCSELLIFFKKFAAFGCRILSAPKAKSILVSGAVRKGERLMPPSALEILLRATFPPSSARIKVGILIWAFVVSVLGDIIGSVLLIVFVCGVHAGY